ncbi:hypothetical protein [Phenylobacterium sp.]|uniref:hypothetical protein n=1 Tax=Phenylobacterium sp. TaxID=1871053 RepID=UPI003BAA8747
MSANDTLTIRFEYPDQPNRHDVPFGWISGVVSSVEITIDEVLKAVAEPSGLSENRVVTLHLTAEPRRGSLVLTFAIVTVGLLVLSKHYADDALRLNLPSLTKAADASTIAALALQVALAPWGELGQVTGHAKPPPQEEPECVLAATISADLNEPLTGVADLMKLAENFKCKVSIQVRSYPPVDLNEPLGTNASKSRLKPPYVAGEVAVERAGVTVYGRKKYKLFRDTGGNYILIFEDQQAVPERRRLSVIGTWLSQSEAATLQGVRSDDDVFRVTRFEVAKTEPPQPLRPPIDGVRRQ